MHLFHHFFGAAEGHGDKDDCNVRQATQEGNHKPPDHPGAHDVHQQLAPVRDRLGRLGDDVPVDGH